jgi:hypothetical protein
MWKLFSKPLQSIGIFIFILVMIFSAPWYIVIPLILIFSFIFTPYGEILIFASILDVYYGNPKYYLFTFISILYLIIFYLLKDRLMINHYVPTKKKTFFS